MSKKIFLIVYCLFMTLVPNANAVELEPYIGVNGGYIFYGNHDNEEWSRRGLEIKNRKTLGVNLGSRINVTSKTFASVEVYYNVVNIVNKDCVLHDEEDFSLVLTTRNLAGLNFGFGCNLNRRFRGRIFASLDVNKLKVSNEYLWGTGDDEIALCDDLVLYNRAIGYGLGVELSYNIIKSVEAKLGYKIIDTSYDGVARTQMVNCGLAYNF